MGPAFWHPQKAITILRVVNRCTILYRKLVGHRCTELLGGYGVPKTLEFDQAVFEWARYSQLEAHDLKPPFF